jgi:hypothetical protein
MQIFDKIQKLDRRWIYLILAVAIIIPLIIPFNSKTYTTKPVEDLYKMIDSFAPVGGKDATQDAMIENDRAVLLSFAHDAATMPELFPMELAILRHAFERRIKVFTMTFLPTAAPIMDLAINMVKEEFPHVQSGIDYVNFGYKVSSLALPIVLGMGDNIAEAVDIDAEGRKLSSLPIMTNIKNYNNMNLIVEFSGSAAGGMWIVYARSRFGANVAVGVTAVMAADNYPFLQTGQLIGMLAGLKGASEYELLVDVFAAENREFSKEYLRYRKDDIKIAATKIICKYCRTDNPDSYYYSGGSCGTCGLTEFEKVQRIPYKFKQARIGMNAQSIAHILIIVFILIGNIGYFVQKYTQAKES